MIQKPELDTTIDEIHQIRREISEHFAGDIAAIAEDAARRLAASNRPVWRSNTTNQVLAREFRWRTYFAKKSQLPETRVHQH